jgi:hypothetical protein
MYFSVPQRYEYQAAYNGSLRRQIKEMTSEVDDPRSGVSLAQVSRDMDRMSATECGLYVKKLKNELLSLKGNTYTDCNVQAYQ